MTIEKNKLFSKLTLYNESETKVLTMSVSGWKGFYRFKVWISDKSTKKNELRADVPVRREAIYALIDKMQEIADSDKETTFAIDSYSPIWEGNVMTNNKKSNGKIIVGKKEIDGKMICYLLIITPSDKKYPFKLLPTPFIKLMIDGKELDDSEASIIWTKAYAANMKAYLDTFAEMLDDNEVDTKVTSSKTKTTTIDESEIEKLF